MEAQPVTRSVMLGEQRVDYALRISRTARKCRIKVGSQGVEVIVPSDGDAARAEAFLQEHAGWVLNQLAFVRRMGSLRADAPALAPNSILLRGIETPVEIVEEPSSRAFGLVDHVEGHLRLRVPKGGALDPARILEAWLRRQARADIEARLAVRGKEMGQTPGRVYIMDQRTKWGGCSRRGNLSFNWRLVMAPSEVLDYIVVHELAHLAERNHSTRFWLIVRSYCPEYERCKGWLREKQGLLRSRLK